MKKQDKTFTRTAPDVERKYNLGQLAGQGKEVSEQSVKLTQLSQSLAQFESETNAKINELQGQVEELAPEYDELGVGLKIENRKLCVDSATDFNGDNTRPVAASFMQLQIGNIEELLKTI